MLIFMELSESDLVERIAAGDAEAEAEFCSQMAPRIRLYGLRHLRNAADAEDLMQHVLLTALQALRAGRLRESEKLSSFVLGTCRLTVFDRRRGVQRREQLLAQFGINMLAPAPAPGPQPDAQKLAGCVQGLRERERAVILMSFYDDETAADVARFLAISEANVRVIRHRALHSLRGCMGVAE